MKPIKARICGSMHGKRSENDDVVMIVELLKGEDDAVLAVCVDSNGQIIAIDISHLYLLTFEKTWDF